MNKIHKILIFTLLLTSFSSCKFLEVERVGKTDIPTFFADVSSLTPSINGIYNEYYGVIDSHTLLYAEVAGDHFVLSSSETEWRRFANFESTYMDETTPVGYIWQKTYNVIANCNQLLYWAPKLHSSYPNYSDLIENTCAEALFMRALCHFDLVRVYAQNYTYTENASHLGVPIITWVPAVYDKIARNSVKEVYAQIIKDLNDSANKFTSSYSKNAYYASPLACKALLSRVYLYMGDYENAIKYASEVISKVQLTERKDYIKMYTSKDEISSEAIFRLNGYNQSSVIKKFFDYSGPKAAPSQKLKALFIYDNDIRMDLFKIKALDPDTGIDKIYNNTFIKYQCTDAISDEKKHYNTFILRASEMYLIRAEAQCKLGYLDKAAEDIKILISRATGSLASEISLPYSNQESLDKLIMQERQRELCGEGHRFFDLARRHENIDRHTDTNLTLLRLEYPDYRYVLAIPYIELTVNSMMEPNPDKN